jgi:hypothetical protein
MTAYRMAPDATSETGTAGAPSRSAGNRNTIRTANATTMPMSARSPRQRATATTTTANVAARIASGHDRSKSKNAYDVDPFWSTCLLTRMSSPTARLGWPGPPLNSRRVLAPLLGPEPICTSVCTH